MGVRDRMNGFAGSLRRVVMSVKNSFAYRYNILIPVIFILVAFGQMPLADESGQLLVWPLDETTARAKANVSLKPYEIRQGPVAIALGILPPKASGAARQARIAVTGGDAVTITLFADVTYKVNVNSVKKHPDGTMIISARLNNHNIETVVLTIGPDGFLITLQDLNRNLLYRVTGDSSLAAGTVTEIDPTKIPPMIR